MPDYTRVYGANVPGFTAIRLIDVDVIDTIYTSNPLILSPNSYHIELLDLDLAQLDGIHNFKQLNGSGELIYTAETTEAGLMYTYEVSFEHARNRPEFQNFVQLSASKKFVIVIADGNLNFMLLGNKAQPFVFTTEATAGGYKMNGMCETIKLPQYIGRFDYGGLFGPDYDGIY